MAIAPPEQRWTAARCRIGRLIDPTTSLVELVRSSALCFRRRHRADMVVVAFTKRFGATDCAGRVVPTILPLAKILQNNHGVSMAPNA